MALTDYRLLGRSGLRVAPLALGTMTFGKQMGWGSDEDEARRIFDVYVERGGNFIDTANVYTNGAAEVLIGDCMAGKRDRLVLATKYSATLEFGDPNRGGNHRKNMVRSVEESLRRLRTDYIDLLYVHMWDGRSQPDDVMRAFEYLIASGKVLYAGMSDTPAWQVARMQTVADLRGWSPLAALQIEYSLIERTVERELVPMAVELGLGVVPWSPLAGGILSGKYSRKDIEAQPGELDPLGVSRRELNQARGMVTAHNLDVADAVVEIANEIGAKASQVALAWLLDQPGVCSPIIGARTLGQLEDNLGAADLRLTSEHRQRLSAVSTVALGFPHEFLALDIIQLQMAGGCRIAS